MQPNAVLQLARFLPFRLSVLSNVVSGAIAAGYAARFNLTIPEWRVVAVLAETPGLSAAEVAARTAMDKVAVSRAVRGLLAKRRITRTPSRHDRRRSRLSLTRAGRQLYAQVAPLALAYERALLAPLAAQERAQLDAILRKLLGRAAELGPAHTL
ncbi:MAG: MarR family winged helix-turn-helix transcriptional regulator [Steroidobacteraceae bacterium]|nr:MarR family winged helix-turn-helix transcriptional regulator [Steroidobacteraceae bacterium]MDW8257934.1 MarR family winged helix-turn-helix transcriptional regulator [Gammaproteobacteria bacterium]